MKSPRSYANTLKLMLTIVILICLSWLVHTCDIVDRNSFIVQTVASDKLQQGEQLITNHHDYYNGLKLIEDSMMIFPTSKAINLGISILDRLSINHVAWLKQGLEYHPKHLELLLTLGIETHFLGEYHQAIHIYSNMLNLIRQTFGEGVFAMNSNISNDNTTNNNSKGNSIPLTAPHYTSDAIFIADIWFNMAVSYQYAGLIEESSDAYNQCLYFNEWNVRCRLNLAALHHQHGLAVHAIAHYEQILKQFHSSPPPSISEQSSQQQKQHQHHQVNTNSLLTSKSIFSNSRNSRSLTPIEAMNAIHRIAQYPEYIMVKSNLGAAYLKNGCATQAREVLTYLLLELDAVAGHCDCFTYNDDINSGDNKSSTSSPSYELLTKLAFAVTPYMDISSSLQPSPQPQQRQSSSSSPPNNNNNNCRIVLKEQMSVLSNLALSNRAACYWYLQEEHGQLLLRYTLQQVFEHTSQIGPMLPFDTLLLPATLSTRLLIAYGSSVSLTTAASTAGDNSVKNLNADDDNNVNESDTLISTTSSSSSSASSSSSSSQSVVPSRRLRIGFMSYDFNDHPTAHLVEGIFDTVHRQRQLQDINNSSSNVELIVFSYGKNDGSSYRIRLEQLADEFHDISTYSHTDATAFIASQQLHVLLDMQLHTFGNRLQVHGSLAGAVKRQPTNPKSITTASSSSSTNSNKDINTRDSPILSLSSPSPIQVNYLVYPATSGTQFHDVIAVDRIVVPPEHAVYYSESLLILPSTYQISFFDRHVITTTTSLPTTVTEAEVNSNSYINRNNNNDTTSDESVTSPSSIQHKIDLKKKYGLILSSSHIHHHKHNYSSNVNATQKQPPQPHPSPVFVYCNFNKMDKLDALYSFSVWMNILRRTSPYSVLWLLKPSRDRSSVIRGSSGGDSNQNNSNRNGNNNHDNDSTKNDSGSNSSNSAESINADRENNDNDNNGDHDGFATTSFNSLLEQHLQHAASSYGVHPRRIIFAERTDKAQHIARHAACDLFLDTMVYGAHSTATDALKGTLPVLTVLGDAFPSRVVASLYDSFSVTTDITAADVTEIDENTSSSHNNNSTDQKSSFSLSSLLSNNSSDNILSHLLVRSSMKDFENTAVDYYYHHHYYHQQYHRQAVVPPSPSSSSSTTSDNTKHSTSLPTVPRSVLDRLSNELKQLQHHGVANYNHHQYPSIRRNGHWHKKGLFDTDNQVNHFLRAMHILYEIKEYQNQRVKKSLTPLKRSLRSYMIDQNSSYSSTTTNNNSSSTATEQQSQQQQHHHYHRRHLNQLLQQSRQTITFLHICVGTTAVVA